MKILLSLTDQSFRATKSVGIFNVSMGLARGLMHCEGVRELHLLGNDECAAQFANLNNGKADRSPVIRIGCISFKGTPIPFDGLCNCRTVIPDMFDSLQIRRHH